MVWNRLFGNSDEESESTQSTNEQEPREPQSQPPGNSEKDAEPQQPPQAEQSSQSPQPEPSPEQSEESPDIPDTVNEGSDESESVKTIKELSDEFDPENPEYAVEFNPTSSSGQMGRELMISGKDGGGPYAGKWVRSMFESPHQNPTQATWIGYVSSTRTGLREVPIGHTSWFRHAALFGTTGYGKTTLLKNLMVQWAYANWGFCFIDPKGDGVTELMTQLPGHRLDDVIWIEPNPYHREKVVGINFMEPGHVENQHQFEAEVESILDDLKNIIKNESYWGPKMDGILSNIARGMIQSEKPYTLIDMYYILLDEQYREIFAEEVDDPAIQRYARVISEEMDQSDLDPLLRRLQKMVENRITREIVAHREATVNLKDAVENRKIILVKNDIDSADVKRMVATGIMRRIWAAIKARTSQDEEERTPYFMIIDEFDDVVSEDSDVEKMLSKARSMRMSVMLCCQQPSQLPQNVRKSIFGNCDNLLALNPNEPDDAGHIMKRFDEYSATDLTNLGRFKMFTRISVNASQSEPFITNTFPDYPPLRSKKEARAAIDASLEKYGRPRLDPTQAVSDIIIGKDNYETDDNGFEAQDTNSDSGGENTSQDSDRQVQARADEDSDGNIPEGKVLESVLATGLQHYDDVPKDERFIPLEECVEELERRVGDTGYQSIPANVFEELPERFVEKKRHSGQQVIRLKDAGRSHVFQQDTGSAATGGGPDHRYVLRRAFETFTKEGFIVELPSQEGGALPDGVADLPIDMQASGYQEAQRKMEKLKTKWPTAADISGGSDIAIEAETSTIKKPKQTLRNLNKALKTGRKCAFCIKDTTVEEGTIHAHADTAARIMTDPPCVSSEDKEGNRRFYNQSGKMEVAEDVYAIRSADDGRHAYWQETSEGALTLTGSSQDDGAHICKFEDPEKVTHPTKNDVPAHYRYERGSNILIVTINNEDGSTEQREYKNREQFKEDWKPIRPPFIPDYEFPRMPERDDWMIVIYPDDDTDLPPLEYRFNGFDADGNMNARLMPLTKEDREDYDYTKLAPYVGEKSLLPNYDGPIGEEAKRVAESNDSETEEVTEQDTEPEQNTTEEDTSEETQPETDPIAEYSSDWMTKAIQNQLGGSTNHIIHGDSADNRSIFDGEDDGTPRTLCDMQVEPPFNDIEDPEEVSPVCNNCERILEDRLKPPEETNENEDDGLSEQQVKNEWDKEIAVQNARRDDEESTNEADE